MSEQQRLISVEYHQLKGLKDVKINFEPMQVTGIFGVNGLALIDQLDYAELNPHASGEEQLTRGLSPCENWRRKRT